MEPTSALDRKGEPAANGSSPPGESGSLEELKSLWHELRGLAHDQLKLAALETSLAGKSLVTMIAAGVMVAVLLISAWLGLMGAAVLWLIGIGVAASIALLLAVAANLVCALVLYDVIHRQGRHLQFPATLRSLRPAPSPLRASEQKNSDASAHATTT
jgi:hypothetical protein